MCLKPPSIVIVDYGTGNLASIMNMLRKVGVAAMVSCDASVISRADKLILPGVGAFDCGMENLRRSGLVTILTERVSNERIPILGICLGMQIMTRRSEEGVLPGLGWIDAETVGFRNKGDCSIKIPHMGWNTVAVKKNTHLFDGIEGVSRFYFVHSYHVVFGESGAILTTTRHGFEFVSAFQKENILGVQFHPEKSHKFGMTLMKNWAFSG